VRPTRSRRPISAWEPLIVDGGRELPLDEPQAVRDALAYGGRYRTFPGAMTGMKPPQFAVWMFSQLGARADDELVDLYPGSGAIGEAWRRYAGVDGRHVAGIDEPAALDDTSRPRSTADVGERRDTSPVGQQRSARPYDLAAVCSEQALVCPVNGARCESIACVVGCTAADANVDAGRAA
jgi:hypothetical protein